VSCANAPCSITISISLRQILRLGVLQLVLFDQIPAHAAVDTSVEMARRKFGKPLGGFVNALLKNVARQGLQWPKGNDAKALALATSHPEWLVKRWWQALGPHAAARALMRSNQEAPVWLRINPLKTTREEAIAALHAAGLTAETGGSGGGTGDPRGGGEVDPAGRELDAIAPLFLRLKGGSDDVLRMRLFAVGGLSFQDPAALAVAHLLDWQAGHRTLDLCAAPGGKAALLFAMAAARGESLAQARIVCGDLSGKRLLALRDVRDRLGHAGPQGALWPVAQDALRPALKGPAVKGSILEGGFDRILADVPCSNLGVIGRRPEARWRLQESDLKVHGARQLAMLKQAADLLAPGGRMVYATCSPEPEETSEVIGSFLAARPDFALADAGALLPSAWVRRGCLHLYPGETDYDGFFGATLVKATQS
jgi:16S rRNA (cytosine967-C5)-methyltransferase